MSNVKFRRFDETVPSLLTKLEELFDDIRQRAYELNERRGAEPGHHIQKHPCPRQVIAV